jgi:hypothetical protein
MKGCRRRRRWWWVRTRAWTGRTRMARWRLRWRSTTHRRRRLHHVVNFLPPASAPAPVRRTQQQQQQSCMGPQPEGTFLLLGMDMGMSVALESSQLQAGTMATETRKHDHGPLSSLTTMKGGHGRGRLTLVLVPADGGPHQQLCWQPAQLLMGIPTGTPEPSHGLDM